MAAFRVPTKPLNTCRWFLRCMNPATGFLEHPILGLVPVCERCKAFAAKEDGGR